MTTMKGILNKIIGTDYIQVDDKNYYLNKRSKSFLKPYWKGKQIELTIKNDIVSFIKLSQTDTKGGATTPLHQGSIAPPLDTSKSEPELVLKRKFPNAPDEDIKWAVDSLEKAWNQFKPTDTQQLIIRQSCLSNAVKTYELIINKSTIPNLNKEGFFTSIKKLADEYVDWVNNNEKI